MDEDYYHPDDEPQSRPYIPRPTAEKLANEAREQREQRSQEVVQVTQINITILHDLTQREGNPEEDSQQAATLLRSSGRSIAQEPYTEFIKQGPGTHYIGGKSDVKTLGLKSFNEDHGGDTRPFFR